MITNNWMDTCKHWAKCSWQLTQQCDNHKESHNDDQINTICVSVDPDVTEVTCWFQLERHCQVLTNVSHNVFCCSHYDNRTAINMWNNYRGPRSCSTGRKSDRKSFWSMVELFWLGRRFDQQKALTSLSWGLDNWRCWHLKWRQWFWQLADCLLFHYERREPQC